MDGGLAHRVASPGPARKHTAPRHGWPLLCACPRQPWPVAVPGARRHRLPCLSPALLSRAASLQLPPTASCDLTAAIFAVKGASYYRSQGIRHHSLHLSWMTYKLR